MKIGVLGGTFDPIHIGHLRVAEEVTAHLDLSEVIFMPAGQPWLKGENLISPAEHRLEMLRLALAGRANYRLSTMEIERPGPTYTVDTMAELKQQLGEGLFFILGWDNLTQLPRWHQPERLVKLCRLAAVPRVDFPPPDLKSLDAVIPGLSERVILLEAPRIDVNASEIRLRVRDGLSIAHLVPPAVEKYIKGHKLYLAERKKPH